MHRFQFHPLISTAALHPSGTSSYIPSDDAAIFFISHDTCNCKRSAVQTTPRVWPSRIIACMESRGLSWAATRLHTKIGLTGFRTRDLSRVRCVLYRPEKNGSRYMANMPPSSCSRHMGRCLFHIDTATKENMFPTLVSEFSSIV
jgi:hypothetical protein